MATTYAGWVADGRPWKTARPIADLKSTLQGHGFTVYLLGDQRHQMAQPPEDHTPYSNTPWPGKQPYPSILACDIMPGGKVDWRALGQQIVADKLAGVPGTEWIKYINWTTPDGKVLQDSWQPRHYRKLSNDEGHIHISARTDFVDSAVAAGYDPVARLLGEDMALTTADGEILLKTDAIRNPSWRADSTTNPKVTWGFSAYDTWNQAYYARLAAEKSNAKLDALAAAFQALASGGTSVDTAAVIAAVDRVGDELGGELAQLRAERDELQARLAAALDPPA